MYLLNNHFTFFYLGCGSRVVIRWYLDRQMVPEGGRVAQDWALDSEEHYHLYENSDPGVREGNIEALLDGALDGQ